MLSSRPTDGGIAYESTETNRRDIVIRPFPAVDQGRWQVSSSAGGTRPLWARSGHELFYLAPDNVLMRVQVQSGSQVSFGSPDVVLKNVPSPFDTAGRAYDVSPDGTRFLFIKHARERRHVH